ncbi:hypothetical protein INS49_005582 [Diaporthe citri]|uniref:uncharacterized protein n=1 Tax=Diaporthe citri TaxID=83186 RepID=UPI001C80B49B|nr:uncharacterized protein INS49_005582 [Diaporthe citri]KAG6353620.1 hypothetical protein INS49_005582 [Diaporthe citri]
MKSRNAKFMGIIPSGDAESTRVFLRDQLPQMPKDYIVRFKSRLTSSNRPCSRCSKIQFSQFGQESGSSVSEGQITKYIIDLRSILGKRDSCDFCRLLFLALCLPENDPLHNDEIQTSIQRDPVLSAQRSRNPPYHVSFATWTSERTRTLTDSDAKWPFGYTYDNIGIGNSRDVSSNQTSAESSEAVDFEEGGELNDRTTAHAARHLSIFGLVTVKQLGSVDSRVGTTITDAIAVALSLEIR